MHSNRGLTGRRDWSDGERFLLSIALVGVSLLWLTEGRDLWAIVLCWAGAIVGALGIFYFGVRYIRTRVDSR